MKSASSFHTQRSLVSVAQTFLRPLASAARGILSAPSRPPAHAAPHGSSGIHS